VSGVVGQARATHAIVRRRWAAISCLLSLGLVVFAVMRFSGAAYFQLASLELTRSDPGAPERARSAIEKARWSNPENPDFLEMALSIDLAAARQRGESAKAASIKSLPGYRDAVALRPNWPYARANLVSAKLRAEQFDVELNQQLLSMVALGPWEPRLQLLAADVLYTFPQYLTKESRAALVGALDRAVRWQPHEVLNRGDRRGQVGFLCARYSAASAVVKRYCETP